MVHGQDHKILLSCFLFLTRIFSSDPYKDPEVEEWAAIKIQRSFKDFKTQKSRTSLLKSDSKVDEDPNTYKETC